MNRIGKTIVIFALLAECSLQARVAFAVACTSVASGTWNAKATWGAAATGCVGAGGGTGIPGAADTVTIGASHNVSVTVPAASAGITMSLANPSNDLAVVGGTTLTLTGDLIMLGGAGAANTSVVDIGTGNLLSTGSIRITGAGGGSTFGAGSGTVNAKNIIFAGVAAKASFFTSPGSIVNLTGNFGSGGTLTPANPSTLNFNGNAAQTIGIYATFNNIGINNTAGGVSFLGAATINGTLTVASGTLTSNAGALTVKGASTVSGAFIIGNAITQTGAMTVNGSVNIAAAGGAKTFVGPVTVNAGGSWTNTGNSAITFDSGITNNGTTFNNGTGGTTFSVNNQIINGSSPLSFGSITVGVSASGSGISVTNNATVNDLVDLNGSVAASTWAQGPNSTLNIGGTLLFTGTLSASAPGNTINYQNFNGAARTVKLANASPYYNLILSGGNTKTVGSAAGQTLTILGNLTIGAGTSYAGNTFNPAVNLAGNLTDNSTPSIPPAFSSGTGIFTFNGTGAQTLNGTAPSTTFVNAVLNNNAGLVLSSHNLIVTTALKLTSGQITTGPSYVDVTSGSAIGGAGGSKFIAGNLMKTVKAGALASATFEVGTGTTYAPVTFNFASVTAAGNLMVSTQAITQPQLPTSQISATQTMNRYWTISLPAPAVAFTNPSASNSIVFSYQASDLMPAANPPTFFAQSYVGGVWGTPFVASTALVGTLYSTTITGAAITPGTIAGDVQIGNLGPSSPPPGSFDAFESTTLPNPGATTGVIHTKIAGTAFSLDVVAILAGAQLITFTNDVKLELLANTNAPGTQYGTDACPKGFNTIQTIAAAPIVSGRSTVVFAAVPDVYQDVRVRITYAGVTPNCSNDSFAIRPNAFSWVIQDQDWMTPGTTRTLNNGASPGGVVHRAGQPFEITATAVNSVGVVTSRYAGSPTVVAGSPTCVLPAACTIVAPAMGIWGPQGGGGANGIVVTTTATYGEVGAISLQLEDRTFAAIDNADGSSFVIPQSGPALTVGRFVPDSFTVAIGAATPVLRTFNTTDALCNAAAPAPKRTFTYIGQPFGYVTAPNVKITAINAAGTTTTNYTGALWKLTGAVPPNSTACAANICTANVGSVNQIFTGNATAAWDAAQVKINPSTVTSTGLGTGTAAMNAADLLAFLRVANAPLPPFAANISLNVTVSDASEVGAPPIAGNGTIATSGGGATFSGAPLGTGIAFDGGIAGSGNQFYYGQMQVQNTNGSELLPMQVPIQMRYFNGTLFVTNAFDNCTTLAAGSIGRGNFQAPLTRLRAIPSFANGVFLAGKNAISLTAPGAGFNGAMDLVIDLGATPNPATCTAIVLAPPALVGANLPYLHTVQSCTAGPPAAYTQDPTAHVTFGTNNINSNSIYLRENY